VAVNYNQVASSDSTYPGAAGYGTNPGAGSPIQTVDPGQLGTVTGAAQSQASLAAQTAYNNAVLSGQSQDRAMTAAQNAFTNAMSVATGFGYSPGGAGMPAKGTPTMGQMQQWANMYGTAAAPADQYQTTLAYQQQLFNQQQAAQLQAANLSGMYTPSTGGTIGGSVNIGQIDQALQASLGRDYNQDVFQAMTRNLQGQNLSNPAALASINAAIKTVSGGRMQGVQDIAGQLGQGGYSAPQDALTLAAQQQYGAMYGYAGSPLPGEMTQSMQNQLAQQAIAQAGVTGYYNAPSYAPQAQAATTSWDQISGQLQAAAGANYNDAAAKAAYANLTGQQLGNLAGNQATPLTQAQMQTIFNAGGAPASAVGAGANQGAAGAGQGIMTVQYQQQQQQAAQAYLNLLSQLQGPADYGKYLNVLGSTPGGMQGLVGAAAGQYLPGGGTTGVQPQGQTLQNLVGSATSGYSQGGSPAAGTTGGAPGGAGAGYMQMQSATGGGSGGAGGTSYSDYMAAANSLVAPNQIAPQAYNAFTDTQKQMLGGMYAQAGYAPNDVQSLFNQSLPKYSSGGGGQAGSFRLV
jgi:hypothetical protein